VLDPLITFTRASTATYFNSAGVMQTAATNAPRWDYDPVTLALRGLLIEEARTNVLLNSATLGTQSVAATAQAYTLSFYGTGTITKSGTATGALVGTGAAQRVSQTFTPTAGSLTCTVTGSVTNAQLEAGAFATSYIPTTSAAVTRAADACSMPVGAWYDATKGSLTCEYIVKGNAPSYAAPVGLVGANSVTDHIIPDRRDAGGTATAPTIAAAVVSASGAPTAYAGTSPITLLPDTLQRGVIAWAVSSAVKAAHNGVMFGSIVPTTTLPTIASLSFGGVPSDQPRINLWLRVVRYYARVLTDAEMQQVTTP
jgi:hypothetical protein